MQDQQLEFLKRSALWADLSEEDLRVVSVAMQYIKYSKGELIIRQGELGSHLSVLTAGMAEVRVHVHAEGGTVVTVATFRPGDCFGEMSLLTGDAASADVVAIEESETLRLNRGDFNALVAANPSLLRELVRMISRRLSATDVAVGVAREKEQDITRFLQEEKSEQYSIMAGKDRSLKELQQRIEKQACLDTTLLIQGGRGTGKELVARMTHFRGPRKDGPLLSTDCGQITETQWGDQLFGDYYIKETRRQHRAVCYMDLAHGGTLMLKNIDLLPPAVQERLGNFLKEKPGTQERPHSDVRIIATCRDNLADMATTGLMSPVLAEALLENVITVPLLRDRKRDIPELANHFMRKHAQRLNKQVDTLDDQAIIKLVSYDYMIANVQELEESIERAVILTDGATINAEEIFLGPPPDMRPQGFNLLNLPTPVVRFILRIFPGFFRGLSAAIFAFILYQCFLAPAGKDGNLGTTLVWGVWWPALALSFFFVGRAWCAICPMASAGVIAQRITKKERLIPAWLKEYDVYVVMGGFFSIIWVEEVTGMRYAPVATGFLLLAILTGALIISILFPRRTWCRHLCPLGGFAGLCSTSALVELRPTRDICTAKCTEHSCYKGGKERHGCPMFQHVMFVDSNRYCVLCMDCVRNCPNSSPQLNVRIPARELWTSLSYRPEIGQFVALLLGLLVAQIFIKHWEQQPHRLAPYLLDQYRFAFLTGTLTLGAALPLLGLWLASRRLGRSPNPADRALFWQKMTAWAPLLAAGYVCHQLANIPGADRLQMTLGYQSPEGNVVHAIPFSLLFTMQFGILTVGLLITVGVLSKLTQVERKSEWETWAKRHGVSLAGVVIYWAGLLVLMLRPEWLAS